jgi:molybdopterin-biosynthesis enzyme MoeA-like protein
MAEVPERAELLNDGDMKFPLIKFGNVFIFPGIPELLKKKFHAVEHRFSGPKIFLIRVYFRESESVLAGYLNEVVESEMNVKIGSYPVLDNQDYSVIVTFESTDRSKLESAVRLLLGKAPAEKVIRVVA